MPLHLASENKKIKCTDLLLGAGANEDTNNKSLCSADAAGSTKSVELLLRADADMDSKTCITNWQRCTSLLKKGKICAWSFC
jgi:ankyrin repeat protein